MSAEVEFFFDLSSPWTRLAFRNIQPIIAESGARIRWRPFLVGGVFNAVNQSVYAGRADPNDPKVRHSFDWLRQWAQLSGVGMNFPSPHHPLKAVAAMRFCCALEDDQQTLVEFAERAFEAYFIHMRNLDEIACLIEIADACDLDGAALSAKARSDVCKQALRSNTAEAISRGAFGSPMIFIDETHVYFGNDQLPLVEQRLRHLSEEAINPRR